MSILEKFDNIEIVKENVVSEIDMVFCKLHFEFYTKIYKHYESHLLTMKTLEEDQKLFQEAIKAYMKYPDTYIYKYDGISVEETKKAMLHLSKHFIYTICNYFKEKYNVTVNTDLVSNASDKHQREPKFCELSEIVDKCIVGYLNGLSFLEKAIEEIKAKARTERHYYEWRKKWNYDVKGKIIKFRFNIQNIKSALFFYDGLESDIKNCYSYNRIQDFQTFQNGNTDIKFFKSEYAMDFATRFLGYVESK